MPIRNALFALVVLVALNEISPLMFLVELGVLSAETSIFQILGISYFASLLQGRAE